MPARATSMAERRAVVARWPGDGKKEGGSRKKGFAGESPSIFHLPPSLFSEADLARLWQHQTFPPEALVTREGEKLRVIYRGRPAAGPGPDFRDCVIAAPRRLLQGDVELHVRSSDFGRHGHDLDPAYAGVVLHLVFRDDEGTPTALPGGGHAPVVALGDWAEGRAAEIAGWLQRPALWQEPCFSALRRTGEVEVGATLDRLGDMRFRQKAASFASRLRGADPEDVLWEALMEALGYGGAREAFRLLAQRVTWSRLRGQLAPLAATERAGEALRLLGEAVPSPSVRQAGTRPANGPERRLQGAARLAARFAAEGFVTRLSDTLEQRTPKALKELIGLFAVEGWVGRGRAVELVANAALPWLAALGPEAGTRRAESAFRALPLTARYGGVRHLYAATARGVSINFRRQQGMLYLLKRYCTQGGCGRCPLS